ncbi:major facilitator superfamily domain-containing protein [Dactylonectria macrodidyma]|uniref:Major facilitator superfamily domain-containing protein n=1 Tax=Dactylonectria macrodidyma TaxID=307937 RepID=A0A9P9DYG7_9HYPO|nr:major facilitator superfamily domain-containing protein [Dactylonectria macrodidyma]
MTKVVKLLPVTRDSLVLQMNNLDEREIPPPATGYGSHEPQGIQQLSQEMPPPSQSGKGQGDTADHSPNMQQSTLPKPKKTFSFFMSILMLALVALVVSWDSTTLAVATPTITNQLHGTTLQSFWASIAFMLGVVITQPIYSSVSNILGRKFPLLAATLLFTLGCIIFAVAKNMSVIVVGRALQGLGGGGLDVLQAVILSDITTLQERPLYLGIMSLAIAIGTLAGPVTGALFTDYNWRWIGWINLPFMAIVFLLALFFLRLKLIDLTLRSKLRRLDWIGMLLFTMGATFTVLPLSWANDLFPWSSWQTLVPMIVGVLVLVAFGVYETKAKPAEPIVPYRIFANITFTIALVSGSLNGMVLYSLTLYIPLFFQAVFLQPPLQAALSAIPLACVTLGFCFIASIIIEITRRCWLQNSIGWIMTTIFLGLWSLVGKDASKAMSYSFQSFLGLGVGTVFTTTTVQLQSSVELIDDMGLAAGLLVFFRLVGAMLGQTIGATIFNSVFQDGLADFGELPDSLRILEDPSEAIGFIPSLADLGLSTEVMDRLIDVYQGPFQTIWMVMAGFSCAGAVVSFFAKELTLERDEVGRQGFEER